MAVKRFSRNTKGLNAQVFVAKAINITTDATIALFLANAPLGEFGVYDANNALHTDAITASEEFYFVLKTTEGIKSSFRAKLADVVITKKTYVAPVKQVSSIGWTGSGGSMNLDTIDPGLLYIVKVIETTEGNDPYPTWNYEYTSVVNDTEMDIVQALAKKINDDNAVEHKQNNRLVTAKVKADATYGSFAATGTTPTVTVTNGSEIVQIESGANDGDYNVAVDDLIAFDAAAAPSDSVGDIYEVVAASTANDGTFTLNRPYTGATQTFTEAEAEGTRVKKVTAVVKTGLQLTSIDYGTHFRIAKQEELLNADVTYTTAFNPGNGTSDQVLALEKEGQTFAGDTAKNAAFAAKYGQQDTFTVDAETYDYYEFKFLKKEDGIAPEAKHYERSHIIIPVAKSAGNVDSTLDTLFGL